MVWHTCSGKKVRDVNSETVSKTLINESPQHGDEMKQTMKVVDTDAPKVKKIKRKIRIQAPKEEESAPILQDESKISKEVEQPPTTLPPGDVPKVKKPRKLKNKRVVIMED